MQRVVSLFPKNAAQKIVQKKRSSKLGVFLYCMFMTETFKSLKLFKISKQ